MHRRTRRAIRNQAPLVIDLTGVADPRQPDAEQTCFCLIEFDNGQALDHCSSCGVRVHRPCIVAWLDQQRRMNPRQAPTCPFCQSPWN